MPILVELTDEAEKTLAEKARAEGVSVEMYARRALERDLGLAESPEEKARGPLGATADLILKRVRNLPPEAFDGLPHADGAVQHDHYIYGTPKKENP